MSDDNFDSAADRKNIREGAKVAGVTEKEFRDAWMNEAEFYGKEESMLTITDKLYRYGGGYYQALQNLGYARRHGKQVGKAKAAGKKVAYGTNQEVWDGHAEKTRSGLTKADLILNKSGKPVSKKRSEGAKKLIAEGKLIPY